MQKFGNISFLGFLSFFFCLAVAHAEDKTWGVDIASAFNSAYMFRGLNLYHGNVIQPSIATSYTTKDYGTFSGIGWANFSVDESNRSEAFGEIDYTLTYDLNFDFASLTLGHIWYTFYHDNSKRFKDTEEYFTSITANAFLSPTVSFYGDYDVLDLHYFETSFSHKIESTALGEGFNTTPYVAVGFIQNGEKLYRHDGATHVAFGTSSDLVLGSLTITPALNYSLALDDNTENEFWIGITLSKSL